MCCSKDYSNSLDPDNLEILRREQPFVIGMFHQQIKIDKLKQLLKLAVDDMKGSQSVCEFCKHAEKGRHGSTEMPCYLCDRTSNKFEWRYADEAKGLIDE